MAKSTKGKIIQMLSPENYIRQKARSLPIYQCLINPNWQETKFANIVIARQHNNGNITAGVYLVDLQCLGIKDSLFVFNTTKPEYDEMVESFSSGEGHEKITYELAHNIIYAALEYAEEWGFKPYKQFSTTTRYLLEEDNDDVELIDVECGLNGKPCYIQGIDDNEHDTKRILSQLERTAGKGNYDFIMEGDDKLLSDNDEFDDDDDLMNEFDEMQLDEKNELFLNYYHRKDKLNDQEANRLLFLTQSIIDDLVDVEEHNAFYDKIKQDLGIRIEKEAIPNQLLGYELSDTSLSLEMKEKFIQIVTDGIVNLKQMKRDWKAFKKEFGDSPAADYIELQLLTFGNSTLYSKQLKKYAKEYPDYSLLQIKWTKKQINPDFDITTLPRYPFAFNDFFPDRESIHPLEYFFYVDLYFHKILWEKNAAKLDAFDSIIDSLKFSDKKIQSFRAIIILFKIEIINNYLAEIE
ncbi:MAG TPA: hypothetical protein VJY41_06725 [Prolixibacteraceae bacterium]|nr:hypothetical protein [Prolixibacteraceae bacterium]